MEPDVDALLWNGRPQESHGSEKLYGVVPARVVAIADDRGKKHRLGAVQVQFPWLTDEEAKQDFLPWARCITFASGEDASGQPSGWLSTPQIGDEVLVGFEDGDPHRPYVLGGLFHPTGGGPGPTDGGTGTGRATAQTGGGGLTPTAQAEAAPADDRADQGAAGAPDEGGEQTEDRPTDEPPPREKNLRLRLNLDPHNATSRDDRFTLRADDGSFEKTLTVKDDLVPGDRFVDLLFPKLNTAKAYTLEIDPGEEGDPYYLFQAVPFERLGRRPWR